MTETDVRDLLFTGATYSLIKPKSAKKKNRLVRFPNQSENALFFRDLLSTSQISWRQMVVLMLRISYAVSLYLAASSQGKSLFMFDWKHLLSWCLAKFIQSPVSEFLVLLYSIILLGERRHNVKLGWCCCVCLWS